MRLQVSTAFALFTRMAYSALRPVIERIRPRSRIRSLPVREASGLQASWSHSSEMLFRASVALVVVFAACGLRAETSNSAVLTISPEQCVWRVGDNPSWAASAFDDSAWQPYSTWNPQSPDPRIWIRCQADLSSLRNTVQPALQVALYAAYEVYVDSHRIGSAGNLATGRFTMDTVRAWPIPGDLVQPAVIALRITRRIVSKVPSGPVPPLKVEAGAANSLHDRRSSVILAQVGPLLIPAVCFGIIGVLGVVLVPLWLNDRGRRELLLLAIVCAFMSVLYLNYMGPASFFPYSVAAYFSLWAVPAIILNVAIVLFFFTLAGSRVPLVIWILLIGGNGLWLPAMIEGLLPPAQALSLDIVRSHQLEAIGDLAHLFQYFAPFAAFLPWKKLSHRMKPLAACSMAWGVANMILFAVRSTSARIFGIPDLYARWSGEIYDTLAVTFLAVVVALLILLFNEQQQTTRERAILAGEMRAAHQVQSMLAPSVLDTAPGMHVEVAFHPVREVGGDFYSCRVLGQNRQRILIGDVSGKGAAAAMTAAVLIGATQQHDQDSPAALLEHLNCAMMNMRLGGFATCLCAELSATGALTIANAGHLAPYRNGEEVKIDSGFPLGIASDTAYTKSTFNLCPGDTLTFVSDGVVEARDKTGELFGFDRAAAIATESAKSIAHTALSFGQQDDITVLTLRYAPAEVQHV